MNFDEIAAELARIAEMIRLSDLRAEESRLIAFDARKTLDRLMERLSEDHWHD